jgi:hypothetical protein
MSVLRWVLNDPYDSNPATNHYTFPRNPVSMTSVYPERSISATTTTSGKILLYEGTTPAKSFTFSGPILDKQQFTDLHTWVYLKKRRLFLTDHFGRKIAVVFTTMDVVPKRRVNYYWSHDYTITGLIMAITGPSVGDVGPV